MSASPAAHSNKDAQGELARDTREQAPAPQPAPAHSVLPGAVAATAQAATAAPGAHGSAAQPAATPIPNAAPAAAQPAPRGSAAPPTPVAHTEPTTDAQRNQQQPLRSVSLEFAPDGAQDVRVRLSERGGDVHISLHSTDAALAGRLRNGVEDLAGALNHAGYEADAWPNGGGGRNRDAEQQRQQQRRPNQNNSDEDFSGMMRQNNQENS